MFAQEMCSSFNSTAEVLCSVPIQNKFWNYENLKAISQKSSDKRSTNHKASIYLRKITNTVKADIY
jgi:hypothetical protein